MGDTDSADTDSADTDGPIEDTDGPIDDTDGAIDDTDGAIAPCFRSLRQAEAAVAKTASLSSYG